MLKELKVVKKLLLLWFGLVLRLVMKCNLQQYFPASFFFLPTPEPIKYFVISRVSLNLRKRLQARKS
jgi:hypothetical protein